MRKQRQGGGARPTSSPRAHAPVSSQPPSFSLPLSWGGIASPTDTPFFTLRPNGPAVARSCRQSSPEDSAIRTSISSRAFLLTAILTRSYDLVIRLQDRFDCESESNNRYTRNNSMYQLCYRSIRLYRLAECCDLDKLFRERKFRGIAVFLPHGNLDASNICDI